MEWFESRGVPLVIQEDNRVFPESQNSQSIIDCFLREVNRLKIEIELRMPVQGIKQVAGQLELHFLYVERQPKLFDKVIVTTGGSPKREGFEWLEILNHKIENPVPSLFTFNMPKQSITKLMGVVVENTVVNVQGTKLKSAGPLLITHWGMSGPAILKLSAFGARVLSDKGYNFNVQINWVNETNNDVVLAQLKDIVQKHVKKLLANI